MSTTESTPVWTVSLGSRIETAAVIDTDGTIYIGECCTDDEPDYLYAIGHVEPEEEEEIQDRTDEPGWISFGDNNEMVFLIVLLVMITIVAVNTTIFLMIRKRKKE